MADNKTADIKMSTASKTRKSLSKLQKMKDEGEKMAGGLPDALPLPKRWPGRSSSLVPLSPVSSPA